MLGISHNRNIHEVDTYKWDAFKVEYPKRTCEGQQLILHSQDG